MAYPEIREIDPDLVKLAAELGIPLASIATVPVTGASLTERPRDDWEEKFLRDKFLESEDPYQNNYIKSKPSKPDNPPLFDFNVPDPLVESRSLKAQLAQEEADAEAEQRSLKAKLNPELEDYRFFQEPSKPKELISPLEKFYEKPLREKESILPRLTSAFGRPLAEPKPLTPRELEILARFNPFVYASTQDELVTQSAKGVYQNPRFVELETRAVAQEASQELLLRDVESTARQRYGSVVVPALARQIASFAYMSGLKEFPSVTCKAVEAVRDQVNQVNFCPEQVDGILRQEHLRDFYVEQVAGRVEKAYR